jgi:hypothetical protein
VIVGELTNSVNAQAFVIVSLSAYAIIANMIHWASDHWDRMVNAKNDHK